MRLLVAVGACALAFSGTASAQSVAKELNGWQKMMLAVADTLTRGVETDGFIVDYTSDFSAISYGTVLAPGPDPTRSSMSIVGRCAVTDAMVEHTPGNPFPAGQASGDFTLGANASAPPGFLVRALQAVSVGLKLDRKKSIHYALDDISIDQVRETELSELIRSPACVREFNNRRRVYLVRGHYLMQLNMSQGRSASAALEGSAAMSRTNSADPAKVGFNVGWNGRNDWKIEQKAARPWFRIVARAERQPDGSYAIVDRFGQAR